MGLIKMKGRSTVFYYCLFLALSISGIFLFDFLFKAFPISLYILPIAVIFFAYMRLLRLRLTTVNLFTAIVFLAAAYLFSFISKGQSIESTIVIVAIYCMYIGFEVGKNRNT
jgi:hypothetical protein